MEFTQPHPDAPALDAEANVPVSEPAASPNANALWAAAMEHEAAGRIPAALDACEACLRLDPGRLDAWFMLANLGQRVGHHDFGRDVLEVVRAIAPDEPRRAAFAEAV